MTTLASLRILLGLDAGGVRTGGSGVRGELRGIQQEANRTQQTLSQIGKGAAAGLGIGAGLGAFQVASRAVGEFTSFLGDSVKAASEEEDSIARLTSSLKANVPAWDGSTAAIEATLQARARLGSSDDEQRESLARLVAATHDVNEALALQRTAMDLAAFKSVDLLTASTALIKVDGGQFRALKELIGSTKDITTAEQALAAVHEATAGAAEALANTNSGKLKASQIAIDEAMEKFGTVILPVVAAGMQVVADAVTVVADNFNTILPVLEVVGVAVGVKIVGALVGAGIAALGFGTASAVAAAEVATASAAEVGAIGLVATAFEAMKGSAIAAWLASLGPVAIAAGAGAAFIAGLNAITSQADATTRAAIAAGDLTGAQAKLKAQVDAGSIGLDEYDAKLKNVQDQQYQQAAAAALAAGATNAAADAAGKAATAADVGAHAVEGLTGSLDGAHDAAMGAATATDSAAAASLRYAQALTGSTAGTEADAAAKAYLAIVANDLRLKHDQLTDAFGTLFVPAKEAPQVFGRVADAATNAGGEMVTAAGQANTLGAALDALPRDIDINVKYKVDTSGFINPNAAPGTGDADRRFAFDPGSDPAQGQQATENWLRRDRDRRDREAKALADAKSAAERAAADATRLAEKAAADQAAAYRDKLGGAFDAVRHAAETYYAKLHDLNLKAIKDAHDHANALLDAQKAANLAPVNEAQAAQRAIQQQRELAQRQADLMAAQAEQVGSGSGQVSADQKAQDVLRAQQALADFNAQARIAAMQAEADTANAAIDVEKAKNDALAATATQAENDRATAQREAFANDLKALEDSLSKHPETWAKTQQAILKLLMGYGVDYKKAAQNLGDQFAAGLLASTRAAENAAAALANAAGGKLGIQPKPIVLPVPVVPVPVIPVPVLPPPLTLVAPVITVPVIPAPVIPPTVTLAAPIVPIPIIPTPLLPPASVLHPPVVPTPIIPTLHLPPPITLPAPIVPEIPAPSPIDHDAAAAALAAWTTAEDDALALLNSRIGEFGDVGKAQGAAYAEALLGARDAATAAGRAIASAALVAFNVSPVLERTPQPVGAGAGAASAAVADSLGDMVFEIHIHNEIDGEQVSEKVERIQAARYSRIGSGIGG